MSALPQKVILICATKQPYEVFPRATLLGRSLAQLPDTMRPRLMLLADNFGSSALGLSEFYNQSIETIEEEAILVFVHDDVYIHDWNLSFTLTQAFRSWDIVGAAGSARVPYGQVGWCLDLRNGIPAKSEEIITSGSVNHFDPAFISPDYFGPSPMECDLLDGVFIAAYSKTLKEKNLRFDPQFRFHCYDVDFCYTAKSLGLSIGTWPLLITHGSVGNYLDEEWVSSAKRLKTKLDLKQDSAIYFQQNTPGKTSSSHPAFQTPKFQYSSNDWRG